MSKNILLILPSVLKERSGLHTNVDDKLIVPEIKAVQDMYIMPLLGSTLFNKIIADIGAGTLAGNYKLLMDEYLIDAVCNFVMSELAPTLNAQFWNTGVQKKTPDQSQTVSGAELKATSEKYRLRGEQYAQRAKRFLMQNAITMFPEYYKAVAGIDIISPEANVFDSPIYLHGGYGDVMPQKSYNKPDTRFNQ